MSTPPPSSSTSGSETWFTAESAESDEPAESVPAASSDELIGVTLLDSYKVERVLGEGGMGRIYLANHTRIAEKRFAIKVLRAELVSSPHIRARFDREV
jgi:eukaryotic-like serine/threonine-protein kinase